MSRKSVVSIDIAPTLSQEWLEANGRGSYACGTSLDCPSRRYHGLLVSDAGSLADKHVFLAKLEASVTLRGQKIDLYFNKHPDGQFYPEGYQHFESFNHNLCPRITYQVGSLRLERSLMLLYDQDTVLLRYRLHASEAVQLSLRPLLAYRSHHHLRRETVDIQVKTFLLEDGHKIEPLPNRPPLYMNNDRSCMFHPGPFWATQIEYAQEQQRGFDYLEDLFCPGLYDLTLRPNEEVIFSFGLQAMPREEVGQSWHRESQRRKNLRQTFASDAEPLAQLKYEAEKFLIKRSGGEDSVVAGYPWFGEWGRDTMIALPGLTISRGQPQRFLPIIRSYLQQAKLGLVPNYLGQGNNPSSYNSIDAALWMFAALSRYALETNDRASLQALRPALETIADDLIEGRCPIAKVDGDGLLIAGSHATQLTWMDAAVNGIPVTPRAGYAVEINALWINALIFLQELAQNAAQSLPSKWLAFLEKAPKAFQHKFWLADFAYLADSVSESGQVDASIRPNQLFAVSLPYSPLNSEQQQSVVDCVSSHLLTPFGLRSLSPHDPAFSPFYQGGPAERDSAYHQGTVWPWLVGDYAKAIFKTMANRQEAKKFLERNLQPLWQEHLLQAGHMGISEIFDAYYPFRADGCIYQAWSMAAVIDLLNQLKEKDPA